MSDDQVRYLLRRVTEELTATRHELNALREREDEPIAVVGMACRFPGGVASPEDLWRLVSEERDAIGPFPEDRGWPAHGGPTDHYARHGGFLDGMADFDAAFFGMSPRTALATDPQQRLLLETAWETFERAGIVPATLRGSRTGVFVGMSNDEYGPRLDEAPEEVRGNLFTGTATSVASGRIAYTFGLEGPAMTLDTACSSSLTAMHTAIRSLRAGDAELALAGGAIVLHHPGVFADFGHQQGLAADGRCKAFADGADGTNWAEGVGLVLLERLSDAERNGHRVLALVRGSAVNQDGASNGLTAPNGTAQQRLIRRALADAGLSSSDVDVVEAHGTGTALGDPVEAHALLATYGQGRATGLPLYVGSLKSNLGHSAHAAGVGGVIKMVLAMRHGVLPKSLHIDRPSSHVDWDSGAVELLRESRPWPETGRPRRAAVSSFGMSGTNAHVILEQAPAVEGELRGGDVKSGVLPWVVSAKGREALQAQAFRLAAVTDGDPGLAAADVAWSLLASRTCFPDRAVVIGGDRAELTAGLRALADGEFTGNVVRGKADVEGKTVFVFPGHGAQWTGMAAKLLEDSPVFARRFGECADALAPLVDWPVFEVVRAGAAAAWDREDVVQPVLWAVLVSLAEVWRSWGVRPDAVVGHSMGEVAAACVAGALSLEDAARVVVARSKAVMGLPGEGGMLSIPLPVDEVRARVAPFSGRVSIAAVNSPRSVVVSGDCHELEEVLVGCAADGVDARAVRIDYASHSARIDTVRDYLVETLTGITPRVAEIPVLSTVDGDWIDTTRMDAEYWFANLRRPVQFDQAVRRLAEDGFRAFVEASPHPILTTSVREILDDAVPGVPAVVVGTLRRGSGGQDRVLRSLAEAHVRGLSVDWAQLFEDTEKRRVDLPTYAFQRSRHWLEDNRRAEDPTPESIVDSWRYRETWTPLDVPPGGKPAGTWLVAVPSGLEEPGWLPAVVEALGVDSVRCVFGDPGRAELADRVRQAAAGAGELAGVLSLLALAGVPAEGPADTGGLGPTLALVQALGDAGIEAPLWWVTRGAVAVDTDDTGVRPDQAAWWGLGQTAALEYPQRWGGLVDLPEEVDEHAVAALVGVLAHNEDQVAIRQAGVFGRRLVRDRSGVRHEASWRGRGTAVITGGTGALGAHIARWLAGAGAEHLVLVSRRGENAPGAAGLREELTALGAKVTFAACDAADRDAMADLLARAGSEYPVTAIVHAAGVLDDGVLDGLTTERLAAQWRAKVVPAFVLDELSRELDLDAFVLFSSMAATMGNLGQAGYAAANSVLDALAHQRSALGLAATSVAWGAWAGSGMSTGDVAVADGLRRRGIGFMAPELAVAALEAILLDGAHHGVVTALEWDRYAPSFTAARPSRLLSELPEVRAALSGREDRAGQESAVLRRLAGLTPADRHRTLLEVVRNQAAEILGHTDREAVPDNHPFREIGFESVTAIDFRNRLGDTLGLSLPATIVFDHATPLKLTEYLLARISGEQVVPVLPAATVTTDDPIAIVGLACRLPGGATSPELLWQLVMAERDAISDLPGDRGWDIDAVAEVASAGGFLDDVAGFDAGFFGIAAREALTMDPQQRLTLEVAWEALENAGIDPLSLQGSDTGVFVGAAGQDYQQLARLGFESGLDDHTMTGVALSVLSGRLAYIFGLEGPAVTVDTACSSSLTALHWAGQALRRGECDLALAGGVTIMSTSALLTDSSQHGALAGDGRSKAFSDAADGMSCAEGVGIVVLERLSDAERNGHPVLALVRGSAVNQDGASNGLTAPSGTAQQRLIRRALTEAGLSPSDVDAVEAHGTGTALGDPIEASALLSAYGQDRPADRPLYVGSLKSNIGHTQATAGIAGVIKTVLALRHGVLPKSLHIDQPSSHVDWDSGAVELLRESRLWPETGRPRRAGVSAFGISGTNVHVILEAALSPAVVDAGQRPADDRLPAVPWLVSAKGNRALRAQAGQLASFLVDHDSDVTDVAWSLLTTRAGFHDRAVVIGRDRDELTGGLRALAAGEFAHTVVHGVADVSGKTVFVFPGHGSQWPGMAAELLDASPVFARRFGECADALAPLVGWSATEVVRSGADAAEWRREDVVQPVLWAVLVALAEVWRFHGVRPDAVVGHSMGEVAAACVAGVLSLEDGARVVVARSKAITALSGAGGMVSIPRPAREVEALISAWGDRICVAAVNSPRSTVVSGDRRALDEFLAECAQDGIDTRPVRIDYASHSVQIDTIREDFLTLLSGVTPQPAEIPLMSTVDGDWLGPARMDAEYWFANLRRPVRFETAVRRLAEDGYRAFIETSPHPILVTVVQETLDDHDPAASTLVTGTLRRNDGGVTRLVSALAQAHVRGLPVDWARLFDAVEKRRVQLPNYAFQRRRFWISPTLEGDSASRARPLIDGLADEASPVTAVPHPGRAEIQCAEPGERAAKLREVITRLVALALGAEEGDLNVHVALPRLGLDSLLTTQLREMFVTELGVRLPLVAFYEAESIAALGDRVLPLLDATPAEQPAELVERPSLLPGTTDPDARYEPFDATEMQRAYFLGRTDALPLGQTPAYLTLEVDLEDVDLDRLAEAFRLTIDRHDMLRAVITPDGRHQVLREVPRYEFEVIDLESGTEAERASRLDAVSREMRTRLADATTWPLFDVRVSRTGPHRVRLHLGFEIHIADGWGQAVWFHDWAALYRGETDRLVSTDLTYRDCLASLSGLSVQTDGERVSRALDYWRARGASLPSGPRLPLAKDPATVQHPEFTHRTFRIGSVEWGRFQQYAKAAGVTPSAAFCTAYARVLAAWSDSSRFTLNLVSSSRPASDPRADWLLGSFTTNVLLEIDCAPVDRFALVVDRVQSRMWSDLEHQEVGGVRVLRELNRGRSGTERLTAPVVFAGVSGPRAASVLPGVRQSLLALGESGEFVTSSLRTPQVWLDHQLLEDDGELVFNWDSVDELFPDGMIEAMFGAYQEIVRDLCTDERAWQRPAQLLVPPADLDVREAVNATAAPVPQGLLHEDFLAQALAYPQRPAVITGDRTLTYGELDQLSNRLARLLRAHGVDSGSLVGIVAEKGWEQVVAAVAILKAGGAYVPIDAAVPAERLRLLLGNAGISVVATQSRFAGSLAWPEHTRVFSVDGPDAAEHSAERFAVETRQDELAYVIYTSGSTGVPKGVMIDHRAAVNTIQAVNEQFEVTEDDRVLGLSALNFDLSVYDVFGMLSAGGAVVLPEPQAYREPARWAELVRRHGVTMWNTVPKLMEMFVEHVLPDSGFPLRLVMMSGDWIPVTLPERIWEAAPDAQVWSLGGATEAAIWSIWFPIQKVDPSWTSVPYGTPMPNQRFHVLNEAMQPCPVWLPGELYIAGTGLARGYLNDEVKTRAAFGRHPVTGERLYATGDMGRYLPDGNIEFLGRTDLQVKIQGYRIELGEIEGALVRCRGVREAVVTVAGDRDSTRRLVAYVVIEEDHEDLIEGVRRQVPEYMVPQHIVVLDGLPLSTNGKVDRAALPAPDTDTATVLVAARDALEEELVRIWAEFFPERAFGVNSSFFDLGGDSLLAVRLMARIEAATGRTLPVAMLFRRPTVELLAEALRDDELETRREALVPVQAAGALPPLFFVHPVGGDVLCYAELASLLGEEQPFYGLQVPDTDQPLTTISQLAAHYVAAITAAVPHGPYRIGGWSMGGVLALEIAGQLTDAGQSVETVAVIDLVEPPGPAGYSIDEATTLAWFARDLAGLADAKWAPPAETFRATEDRTPLQILHEEATRAGVLPENIDLGTLTRIVTRFTTNSSALLAHAPRSYPGRVRFLRGRDGAPPESVHAWTRLFTGDAAVIDLPGNHFTMMRRPHLEELVAQLRAALPGNR